MPYQRNPLWPYLLLLSCLFALAIAAPRGWQHSDREPAPAAASASTMQTSDARPAVVRPTTNEDLAGARRGSSFDADLTATAPQSEAVQERIADQWRFGAGSELSGRGAGSFLLSRPQQADDMGSTASDIPASDPTSGRGASDHGEADGGTSATDSPAASAGQSTLAESMSAELQDPAKQPPVADQAPAQNHDGSVENDGPAMTPTLAIPQGTQSVLRSTLPPIAEATKPEPETPAPKIAEAIASDQPTTSAEPLRAPLDIVPPEPNSPEPPPPPTATPQASDPPVPPAPLPPDDKQPAAVLPTTPYAPAVWPAPETLIKQLHSLDGGIGRSWSAGVVDRLGRLEKLERKQCDQADAIFSQLRRDVAEVEPLALQTPDQATATQLRRARYALLRRVEIWESINGVRRLSTQTAGGLDTVDILNAIERYEATRQPTDGQRIAALQAELAQSDATYDRQLAQRMTMHYRNANFRVAVSGQLLNRFLPGQAQSQDNVDEVILGAPVHGNSTTSTDLHVQLVPNERQWQIDLVASGAVNSRTYTTHGPVTFLNHSDANYRVLKQIVVDPAGMRVSPATAEVNNDSRLSGLRTTFDSVPLIRAIVRNYAVSQHDQQRGRANREARQKVAARAEVRVNDETNPRLAAAEKELRSRVIEPLERLELDPAAISMSTTDKRVIVRSRLAGRDQLGASTARPEAPSDSLASSQLHESAINNFLDHLDLAGRSFTLPELYRWLANKLGRGGSAVPADLPEDVHVTFAQYNPLVVRCDHDQVELTLGLAEIRQAKRHWRNVEVKASYKPVVEGLSVSLVRDGVIELGGPYQGKPEVALRGIFSKALSKERKVDLLPPAVAGDSRMTGLVVTELVIEDGWIGLAIGSPRASIAHQVGAAPKTTK